MHNKALLSDKFSAALQICRRVRRYVFNTEAVNMSDEDLSKEASLKLPVGHLLIVWSILTEKLSGSPLIDGFTEEEKRAIWALEDLCENELTNNGITSKPEKEWNQLVDRATEFVKTLPAEFLD